MGRIITPPKFRGRMWPRVEDSGAPPALLPTSFPGLQFWYRGDSALPASGGSLTGWTDKSSNGRDLNLLSASKPTVVQNVVNGKTVVRFVAASLQDARRNQPAPIVGAGGFTAFIVRKTPPVGQQQSCFAVDCGTGPNGCISIGHEAVGEKFEIRYVPLGAFGGGTDTTNAFLVMRGRHVGGANPTTLHVNGVQVISGGAVNPAPAGIGQICVGSAGAFSEFFEGDIAEVFLYAPELSVADCQRIEREYLWPYYAAGPFGPGEIAAMVSTYGLAAMWDTGVPSSIVLNGVFASAVQDLSGAGIHVAQAVQANQPQFTGAPIYGTWPSVQFVAANATRLSRLNTSLITTPNVGTLIWVGALTAAGGQFQFSNLNDPAGSEGIDFGGTAGSNRILQSPRAGGLALGHSSSTNNPVTNVPDIFAWVVDGISSTFYVNGIVTANTNGSNPQLIPTTSTDALTIGAIIPSGAGAESFNWLFGAWFNTALPPSLVASVSARLRARIGFPLPVTAGLVQYLRADAGITGTATVTNWADLTGLGGRDVTAVGAQCPALVVGPDGREGIVTTGTQRLAHATSLYAAQPATIFSAVLTANAIPGALWSICDGPSQRNETRFASPTAVSLFAGSSLVSGAIPSMLDRNLVRTDIVNGASSASRINGVQYASGNAGAQPLSTGIIVGNDTALGRPFGGSLRCLLVYNRQLSAVEITQVEEWLAATFGMT